MNRFNILADYNASMFVEFLKSNENLLTKKFTLFVPSDFYIEAYAQSLGLSAYFLLQIPIFQEILLNHITFDHLDQNKKNRFITLANTSFVFNPKEQAIDDVRGNIYGIKLFDKITAKYEHLDFDAYELKGLLIQNQSPFSWLEELPKDPFQHLVKVGDIKGKDVINLCKSSSKIASKCTQDFYVRLLKDLNINLTGDQNPKIEYEQFHTNPMLWMLINHQYKNWSFPMLSNHPDLTWSIIQTFPLKPWDWATLSRHPIITLEIIQSHKNLRKAWDWVNVSRNPNITWEIVQENSDMPWNWLGLSKNPNITWEIIKENPDMPWDWAELSGNINITEEIVEDNIDLEWNWPILSKNPNITWNFVRAHLDKHWVYGNLSFNPNITPDIIEANIGQHWNWANMSKNPSMTFEYVKAHPTRNWNWMLLSENPAITWEIVQANPNEAWNYQFLMLNPNITWEIIQRNIDKPWWN